MSYPDPYGPTGVPSSGADGYGAPGDGAPGYGASAYGASGYGASAYGASGGSPQGYGAPVPPRRRRGMKRMVFGGLGLVANLAGLVVMPVLGALAGLVITLVGMEDPVAVDPTGGTIPVSGTEVVWVSVPAAEVGTADCEFTGTGVEVEKDPDPTLESGTLDGAPAVKLYDLSVTGGQEVTVTCEGVSSVGYQSIGVGGTLISLGVGLVIPIVLGVLSLVLLIWGIVARVNS